MAAHLTGAERLLWDAASRAQARHPDMLVLILHLSRLVSPAPRPYHSRIARVLLQDTATRHAGQVFAMRNQDLVLLARAAPGRSAPAGEHLVVHGPEVLPRTLATLFAADVPLHVELTSLHAVATASVTLLRYLAACAVNPVLSPPAGQPHDPVMSLAALHAITDQVALPELLASTMGVRLALDRHPGRQGDLVPAFLCIGLSFSALHLDALVAPITSDPFLSRHLAAGFDLRLISLLCDDIAASGGLARRAITDRLTIHVELGTAAVLSPEFHRFAELARCVGLRFGVAMSLAQASADLCRMAHIRQTIVSAGGQLLITQLHPRLLEIARPEALRPDLVKLIWSACLQGYDLAALSGGTAKLDPVRTVLQGVNSPIALAWGRAQGLTYFEGPFIDQRLAAQERAGHHDLASREWDGAHDRELGRVA